MGKKFFTGWVLWQQMTFVLACGIVVTIFLGLLKLKYDHYRMAKYTKVEKGKQTQETTPEMLEAQHEETKDDVPFGIRAIESGIEVDGVWISRTNTPVGSSRSSITDFKLPRSHTSSQLELPQMPSSSRASSRAASSFDMAVGAEHVPSNESRSSSPGREGRARPPVSMNTRYNYNVSRTLHALEGGQASGPSSGPPSSRREPAGDAAGSASSRENSGRSSRRTSDEDSPVDRPYEPAYINPKQPAVYRPIDPRTDLNLLQSHRMSHVAETGQLTPRARFRPGYSGEWASFAENVKAPEDVTTSNGVDYFAPRKTPSPPLASTAAPSDVSPAMETPATSQEKQAVPLLESYAPRPYYLPDVYRPKGPQHQFSYDEMPIEVNTSQNQQRDANGQVLRKVNSGFEILRPGTLPSPEEEQPTPTTEKRQSKRLQKKRRTSSSASRTSYFVEQV